MKPDTPHLLRLQFLVRVVNRECRHLRMTDERLFADSFTLAAVAGLEETPELAERVEAFVSRLGRLQDTLGDKLLPALLIALEEKPSSVIDNLNRAERLGWLESTETWVEIRKLRNQMVHEYIENPVLLWEALQTGHGYVPVLVATATRMIGEISQRGWGDQVF